MKNFYFGYRVKAVEILKKILLLVLLIIFVNKGWAQVTNDYRSATAGTWIGGSATWERYNNPLVNGTWQPSSAPTANTSNTVYIRHSISANGSFGSLINLIVDAGGTFTVTASSTAASILVNTTGILQINAALTNTANFIIESGGRANLNNATTSGISGLWNGTENFKSGSTFEIQNWNYGAGNPTARLIQNPSIISANTTGGYYFGNLIISGSPSSLFVMSANSQTINLAENNFTSSTTAGSNVAFTNAGSNIAIGGNLIITSSQFSFAATTTANNPIATINGSIILNGGTIDLNQGSAAAATSTIQLKKDLNTLVGSNLISTDDGCKIIFSGSTIQNISIAGALATRVDFEIAGLATAQLINQNLVLQFALNDFDVLPLGTLNFNGFNINGVGNFSQASTASLKITSALGINPTGNNTGNVQNTGTRTFSQTGYFYFTGSANPQSTGLAILSGAATAKRIFIEKTNSTDVVNLTQSTATSDQLTITTGTFVETPTSFITGGGVLNMATGGTYKISVLNATVPQLTGTPYTLSGASTIELNGAGNQDLRGAKDYRNLIFSNSGLKTVGSGPSSITGTISVANTAILDVANNSMGGAGTNLTMTGNSVYKTAGTSTKPDAQGTYSLGIGTTIEFTNNAASTENIRIAPNYYNIIVSGSSVANSSLASTPLNIQTGGNFAVTATGIFKHANINGFSGAINTTISTINNPTITLAAASTIDYYRTDGTAQNISNAANVGLGASHYSNLTLSGSGIKTAPSTTLSILGNISKTGTCTFANNNSTVSIDGTLATTQTYSAVLPAIEFNNLINNNTNGGFTIANDLGVEKMLILNNNSRLVFGIGNINLRSTATNTASVAQVSSNTASNINYTGIGRFIVERFIPSGRKWRFLSAPALSTQTIRDSWMETALDIGSNPKPGYGTIVTDANAGAVAAGFDAQSVSGPSMKYYTTLAGGYTGIANPADLIGSRQGYMTFVRGDRSALPSNTLLSSTVLRTTGQLKTGTISTNGISAGEYVTIGNPYPSQIDLRIVHAASTNISPNYYVWDPKLTGVYGLGAYQTLTFTGSDFTIVPGGGSYGTTGSIVNTIESGSAFFAYTNAAASAVIINENAKLSGSNEVNFTGGSIAGSTQDALQILSSNLYLKDANGFATMVDGNAVIFGDTETNNVDYNDAQKLTNLNENVSLKRNNTLLAIERRAIVESADTVFLNIANMRVANYSWKMQPLNINPKLNAYFVDKFLQTSTVINLSKENSFDFSVTSNTASKALDRFMIVFEISKAIKIDTNLENEDIIINPNPIKNKILNFETVNLQRGKYHVEVINASGQKLYNGIFNITHNSQKVNISLKPETAAGNYFLKVSSLTSGKNYSYKIFIL